MDKTEFIPRKLLDLYYRINSDKYLYYFGSFNSWAEASESANKYGNAYESENIIRRVAESTQMVRAGEAVYEQDGQVFYEERYIYELLTALYYIANRLPEVSILDFGGALGSTYFRYRKVLPKQVVSWNVVEQKHYVDLGMKSIPEIKFYYTVNDCVNDGKNINVALLLSVLPYLENPYAIIDEILQYHVKYIVIDETVFSTNDIEEKIVLQHVPEKIYKAVYPSHILNEKKLVDYFSKNGYKKIFGWDYPGGTVPTKTLFGFDRESNIDRGFLFERVDGI